MLVVVAFDDGAVARDDWQRDDTVSRGIVLEAGLCAKFREDIKTG